MLKLGTVKDKKKKKTSVACEELCLSLGTINKKEKNNKLGKVVNFVLF